MNLLLSKISFTKKCTIIVDITCFEVLKTKSRSIQALNIFSLHNYRANTVLIKKKFSCKMSNIKWYIQNSLQTITVRQLQESLLK